MTFTSDMTTRIDHPASLADQLILDWQKANVPPKIIDLAHTQITALQLLLELVPPQPISIHGIDTSSFPKLHELPKILLAAWEELIKDAFNKNELLLLESAITNGINPDKTIFPEKGTTLVNVYREIHNSRNNGWARQIVGDILSLENSETSKSLGALFLIDGSMFSGKSKLLIQVIRSLRENQHFFGKVKVFTSELVKKTYIGTKQRYGEADDQTLIPAIPMTMQMIYDLEHDKDLESGDAIVIDEASFIPIPLAASDYLTGETFGDAYQRRCNEFDEVVHSLRLRGIHVIIGGLRNDARGFEFPLIAKLRESITDTVEDAATILERQNVNTGIMDFLTFHRTSITDRQAAMADIQMLQDTESSVANRLVAKEFLPASMTAIKDPEDPNQVLVITGATETVRYDLMLSKFLARHGIGKSLNTIVDLLWRIGISDINREMVKYGATHNRLHVWSRLLKKNEELAQALALFGTLEITNVILEDLKFILGIQEKTSNHMDTIET